MRVTEERFREMVERAIDALPEVFRSKLENVEIVVEPHPRPEQQARFSGLLLGLYSGIPKSRRSTFQTFIPPDLIFLFQRNIERVCGTEGDLERQVRSTLKHEIAHHFGMTDDDLDRL